MGEVEDSRQLEAMQITISQLLNLFFSSRLSNLILCLSNSHEEDDTPSKYNPLNLFLRASRSAIILESNDN